MKKYLLLVEDEKMWENFKKVIDRDLNTEIMSLIEKKIKKTGGSKSSEFEDGKK